MTRWSPGGQRGAALADDSCVTVRQAVDERVESGRACRIADLVVGGVRPGVADVLRDRGVKPERLLVDEHHVAPQILEREVANIVAIHCHRSLVWIEQP